MVAFLGACGALLEVSWASWGRLRGYRPSWTHLGGLLGGFGPLGVVLRPLGANLGQALDHDGIWSSHSGPSWVEAEAKMFP